MTNELQVLRAQRIADRKAASRRGWEPRNPATTNVEVTDGPTNPEPSVAATEI
jgi:hypothetical protein